MRYPANILSLLFVAKGTPELHEILEEFLQTIPHMKTWIISRIRNEKLAPCYVVPSNYYTGKIIHKIMYCMIPEATMPIVQSTYYFVGIDDNGNSYQFAQSNSLKDLKIVISKEDYENYLSYA
jgi:hypothetical protein